jgi:hypothetical protein
MSTDAELKTCELIILGAISKASDDEQAAIKSARVAIDDLICQMDKTFDTDAVSYALSLAYIDRMKKQ